MEQKYPMVFATFLILLSSFLILPHGSKAQCTPNTGLFSPGYYPEPLPRGCKDIPYSTQLDIVFLTDTVLFGQTIPFDSIAFTSITDLATGLSFNLNSPNGRYICNPPNVTRACANITGVPTVSNIGADSLELTWIYYTTVFGFPNSLSVTHKIQLTILEGPVVGFSQSSSGLDVMFATTTPGLNNYAWDFGDGGTSTLQDPLYTYAAPGVYNVCLSADDGTCPTTHCQTVTVSLTGAENEHSMGHLQVLPCPAQDHLMVTFPNSARDTKISIKDICGKHLLERTVRAGESQIDLPTDAFENGCYLLVIDQKGAQKTVRFQIMR